MRRTKHARSDASAEDGFSVAELLLGLLITSVVLVGALGVFDLSARAGRVQTQVAQMQQAMRSSHLDMLQMTRLAGRGGLARGAFPSGIAVMVSNNVASGTVIAADESGSPEAAEDTDILTIRGVFETPLYQVNPANPNLITSGSPVTEGEITIPNRTPSGIPIDLTPLKDATGRPEAILLVGPLGDYAVVELKPNQSSFDESGGVILSATMRFRVTSGTHTNEYLTLTSGGVFPPTLASVAFVGILEEHRYYIRDDPFSPMLSHARLYPGTGTAYDGDVSLLEQDIARGVIDLQVALGIDTDTDGDVELAEWLFDASGDDPTAAIWNGVGDRPPLRYVRINSLTRTERPEPGFLAEPVIAIEDRAYNETAVPPTDAERNERSYRRRTFQTTLTVRNI